ncbi:MAG TPA: HDIG domain-containing protein, partial [Acidobacteriota bacterium]|nr:HDIG domain-containing protein [Acidobacteriota bacterium]
TIRSPREIQIQDVATTDRKRAEARERVLPVYDFEPDLAESAVARLGDVFNFLRSQEPLHGKSLDKLADGLNQNLNIVVDPAFLAAAARENYSQALEQDLARRLRKALSRYIISDRNVLYLYASRGLTVHNVDTGREETMNVTSVEDIHQVHDAMRTELESDELDRKTVLAYSEFLNRFITPTINMNSAVTQARVQEAARSVEPVFYQIKKGKVIVRDGEEVTPTVAAQLKALQQTEVGGPPFRYSIGLFLLLLTYFVALKKHLNVHQYNEIKLRDKAVFALCGLVLLGNMALVRLGLIIAGSLSSAFTNPPYQQIFAYQIAIPFAAGALLLSILTDRQIATVYSFALAILTGLITRGEFYLALYCLATGITGALSIRRYYQRSSLLKGSLMVWLTSLIAVYTIYLLREASLSWHEAAFLAGCTLVSAVLSAAVVSVSAPLLEWMFNITTDIKLLELSNLDLPVLRQLALEAPGTYHHSIVMGTIAEAAAEKVGANPLFLRVAALYHDIGKIRKSEYYVENQREFNKHDTLNPRMSALVIINHVKEGLEVARMLRLPSDVAAMIPQHHGTRLITYFYKKAKDLENPEMEQVREEDYRYPGPRPQSKEGAILMLADATEAASRTLTDPSPARIRNMVHTIFRAIFEDGQLDESNLTMKDLKLIHDAFVRKLESVFHHRIAYPGYEFNKDDKPKDSGPDQDLPEKMVN